MLGEYKVNRCTRRCFTLGRPLKEAEWYYSVVIEDGEQFERRDYSAEAWTEPPEGAIGWWKNQMPSAEKKKLTLAPPEVLIQLLRQMSENPAQGKNQYLLALLLLRRRIVREATANETSTESPDVLRIEVGSDGDTMEIPVAEIRRSEVESLNQNLQELLYCEVDEDQ
ncbi:hypothetical protein [Crateriforma conspicua]|uniref:Uncharacterized protein n=1 Tax=Crateriforma conspicua TaxID=2527996 RepID=A0A5C6FUW8_9PLAN|nr:hypothetical protein [Crateriforma conspicua]TWU65365.1 hypothetical protein V7x_09120 [Crateriforma conspicua]